MPDLKFQYAPLDVLTVTSEKGERFSPTYHEQRSHQGMDFSAAGETNLYNAHDGTVIYSDVISGYGTSLIIKDEISGQSTLYAHLSKKFFNKGDSITGRTLIGKTGNSGTKQYHLHFEVFDKDSTDKMLAGNRAPKFDDKRLNPRTYFAAVPSLASMFSTSVHSGDLGLESREGDWRDNKMFRDSKGQMTQISGSKKFEAAPMTFYGLGGKDEYRMLSSYQGETMVEAVDENGNSILDSKGRKTYKEVSQIVYGKDAIADSDNDGTIFIDGITLSGNALPKTDSNNVKIEGVWNLSGFDLHKVANDQGGYDLMIVKSGADVSNEEVGKVSVKNFSINSHFSMYKTKVNFLAQNYL